MKRVKIMLMALTVLAVVGGALAFKAQKFSSSCYYSDTVSHDPADPNFVGCIFRGAGTITGALNAQGTFNTTIPLGAGYANCTAQDNDLQPQLACTQKRTTAGE